MLVHSFVLDALDTTGADTFSHFEMLIDEHRRMTNQLAIELTNSATSGSGSNLSTAAMSVPSRLKQLVPVVGTFYTRLPLRKAFEAYNAKYGITKRRHICISFNEIRHILNLAQIIAMIHPYADGGSNGMSVTGEKVGSSGIPPLAPRTTARSRDNGKRNSKGDDDESVEEDAGATRMERQSETDERVLEAWADTPRTWTLDDSLISPSNSPMPSRPSTGNKDNDNDIDMDCNKVNGETTSQTPHKLHYRDRSESIRIEQALSLLPTQTSLPGPKLICFDGDQTLYSDGANFESNPKLAKYLYLLLKHGVTVAVVTAAGYEYQVSQFA